MGERSGAAGRLSWGVMSSDDTIGNLCWRKLSRKLGKNSQASSVGLQGIILHG
eukprot:CAMPEP_0202900008 /NCGR_PEP_ID=MMETSP1392-20130828/9375_1 /ASSEMBLY_ACC=CAM_ASM_000868 /TAXON_ID=225041 /ORGANISM="Chlamydomonas chlamydogama, Strain SAG 11-48b" /LENGTH=52 /DNA_ID=CAMNT_0049586317 /DNA_START=2104 /DNA_END=2262 /DNA_ORIENTATION=-